MRGMSELVETVRVHTRQLTVNATLSPRDSFSLIACAIPPANSAQHASSAPARAKQLTDSSSNNGDADHSRLVGRLVVHHDVLEKSRTDAEQREVKEQERN